MHDVDYYDDPVTRILAILEAAFGDYFVGYYDGEPENMTEEMLPCVMALSPRITATSDAAGIDQLTEKVTVIIALNKRDDLDANTDTPLTLYRIRKLVIGQDKTLGPDAIAPYHAKSIMGVLRPRLTLNNGTTTFQVEIDFDTNVRGQNTYTQEAYITFDINSLALVGATS